MGLSAAGRRTILHSSGPEPYRYFHADREVEFLAAMLQQTMEQEIPQELAWLQGYDEAYRRIDAQFDLPANEISRLIRMIRANGGRLAVRKRRQFDWIPDEALAGIERTVREAFDREQSS